MRYCLDFRVVDFTICILQQSFLFGSEGCELLPVACSITVGGNMQMRLQPPVKMIRSV